MADSNASQGTSIGKLLVYVTILCGIVLMGYRYLQNSDTIFAPDYTSVPKEMQVTYVPSEFNYEMDDESTLGILANPHRYRREFNDLVYNFNVSLLEHVANRMNLPDSLKSQVEMEYQKHHPYLRQLYYNDFVAIRDTSANVYEAWYNNESTSAVDVMNEVASKYSCFLVNHVISGLIKTDNGKFFGKGKKVDTPCGIAITEALRPMMRRLQDKAAIIDFSRSQGMMEEKVENVIAELATMEVRDKKGINKQLQTKIWGYAVSSTDIEISAISILKVGFKLDDYFKIKLNAKSKDVIVTLPEPTILSHEVFPKVDKLDVGWMRELDNADLNKNFNILRREFRKDALNANLMDKSKQQAAELMQMILSPVLVSMNKKYKLRVRFKRSSPAFDDPDTNQAFENIEQPDRSSNDNLILLDEDIPY